MIPQSPSQPELNERDPDQLSRLLELQLAEKRMEWKQKKARYRTLRSLSFLLLFLVIVGALFASFLIFSRVNEGRAGQANTTEPATRRP